MNNEEEKISIILPLYNAELYIEKTVCSILSQSYSNFEIIAIDDRPTDKTIELFYKFEDSRIKLLHNDSNMGVSYSRNRGIDSATGDYIIFMDHDDIMPENRLKKQIEFLQNNKNIDAVGGKIQNIDSNGNITGTWNPKVLNNPKFIRAILMFGNVFINSSVMYRASVIKKNEIRFRDNSFGLEDYIFLLEVSKKGSVSGIDSDVLFYRRHSSNTEKIILSKKFKERAERYSEVIRFAFKEEGFVLSDEDFLLLDKIFVESPTASHLQLSFVDISNCCLLWNKILFQAKQMSLSNKTELLIALKRNLAGRIQFVQ